MNITLKGSEHMKLASIFSINNLSYLNAGCPFLRKLCRAQYTWKTFFNLAPGRRWQAEQAGIQVRGRRW